MFAIHNFCSAGDTICKACGNEVIGTGKLFVCCSYTVDNRLLSLSTVKHSCEVLHYEPVTQYQQVNKNIQKVWNIGTV